MAPEPVIPNAPDPVVIYPDKRLRLPCSPCAGRDPEDIKELAARLVRSMRAYRGVGVAAPQIGVPMKMFVLDMGLIRNDGSGEVLVFCDPVVEASGPEITADEGCLSFPKIFVPIRRPTLAKIKAKDVAGNDFEVGGDGLLARAIQHEHDHLIGRLMIDHLGPVRRDIVKRKLRQIVKQSDHG